MIRKLLFVSAVAMASGCYARTTVPSDGGDARDAEQPICDPCNGPMRPDSAAPF